MTEATNAAALQQLSDERRAVLSRAAFPPEANPVVVPDTAPTTASTSETPKPPAKVSSTPKKAAVVAPRTGEADQSST